MKRLIPVLIVLFSAGLIAQTARHDKGIFTERKKGFFNEMKKEINAFAKKEKTKKKRFSMDFSGMDLPKDAGEFTQVWHNPPISQGFTGTCWCFSTTSYLESEIYRQTGQKLKLSEMYTVYWEYVEKARRFVQQRGDSEFGQGSEANAVPRIWKQYGIVPEDAYTGLKEGQKFHDHRQLFKEMNHYLQTVKDQDNWNEALVLSTIKSILDHYLGVPPRVVQVGGRSMTPQEYLKNVVQIKLGDFVDVLSLLQQGYGQKVEHPVPDNWWHDANYNNIPLDQFMSTIKNSIRNGYSLCIGGDVSETGYDSWAEVAMVPSFDIPSDYIDENARQFRFSNKTTTDDHGIHIVGYQERNGVDWFLIKDSGSGSRNGANKGYYFYHEDYVKLKIMDFMVHKDMVKDVINFAGE